MKGDKGIIVLFILLAAAWLLLTFSFQAGELIAGAITVIVVVFAVGRYRRVFGGVKFLRSLLFGPVYLLKFLVQLIRANLDVARRVLSPSLPINPGIVCVNTDLESPIGKLILANSITLTPGTLTLDSEKNRLFIHWIDVYGENCDESTQVIVRGFEKTLKEVVE